VALIAAMAPAEPLPTIRTSVKISVNATGI
jgi:hypothetical protein